MGDRTDAMRLHHRIQKIPREVTGLNGAVFVHLDIDDAGRCVGVRISHKQKDDSTLDKICTAIGDAVTEMMALAASEVGL